MRSLTKRTAVVLSLIASSAWATNDGPVGKGKEGPGASGGGPSGGGFTGGGQNALSDAQNVTHAEEVGWGGLLDLQFSSPSRKYWEVGGAWESHALLTQTDLEGAGSSKYFHYFYLYAFADITRNNRLSIRGGATERFLADQGESGWRLSDLIFSYTRRVDLPWDVTLRLRGSLTAPTSFSSQLTGQITSPTVNIILERTFGRYLAIEARVFGSYYIAKYASAPGGNPNAQYSFGWLLSAEFEMPFHKPLSVGAELYTEYYMFYNPNGATSQGTVTDSQFASQPLQQVYGGEVFVKYQLPRVAGVKADLSVAYAQGDPAMGYTSANHDGIAHFYPFWRLNSEMYGVLSLAY